MADPRRPVARPEIDAIADADARENWHFLRRVPRPARRGRRASRRPIWRSSARASSLPPLFLNQLVHLILRNALDACEDPYVLRAAELFFRPQRVSLHDGALCSPTRRSSRRRSGAGQSPLVAMLGQDPAGELDVLDDANAWSYWSRSDALHDGAQSRLEPAQPRGPRARRSRCSCAISSTSRRRSSRWSGSRTGTGAGSSASTRRRRGSATRSGPATRSIPDASARVLGLFRLTFAADAPVEDAGRRPSGLPDPRQGADRHLRLKPQNLVVGLPLAGQARAA